MSNFPDPDRSVAVLIGVSNFSVLKPLPAVANNLRDLGARLRSKHSWALPNAHCIEVHDPASAADLIEPIEAAAEKATDTLLVYYAGHGILGPTDLRLHLSLVNSVKHQLYLSVVYDHVRFAMLNTRAARRLLVLDCCFAARAFDQAMGDTPASTVATQAFIAGTCILAAAASESSAIGTDDRYTAFTGALLKALDPSNVNPSEVLDVSSVFARARHDLHSCGLPRPEILNINDAAALALVRGDNDRLLAQTAATTRTLTPSQPPAAASRPWRFYVGGAPAPAYATPRVVLTGNIDQVVALDQADGQLLWRREFPLLKGAAPIIQGENVLVAGGDNHVWSLDVTTGEPRWWIDLLAVPTAAPTVVGGAVIATTQDGCVTALDSHSENLQWQKKLSQPVHGPMAADGRTLYFGGHDCHVRAWSADGVELWSFRTRKWFDAPPAIHGDSLFIGGYDRRLYRLDRTTGELHWHYSAGGLIKGSPAVNRDLVIFGAYNGVVYALDAKTGVLRWTYQANSTIKASPVVRGTVVYVAARDGTLHAIDARNGHPRWRYTTGGSVNSTPVAAGPLLVVGSDDGYVYALDGESGRGPAT